MAYLQRAKQPQLVLAIVLVAGLGFATSLHALDHDSGHDGECVTCRLASLAEPGAADGPALDVPQAHPTRADLTAEALPEPPTLEGIEARGPPA